MKGLLLKDCYTLFKQMKIFLFIIIIFAFIPGYNISSFAIVYAAMLPITALAYDEHSKWNTLADMMPYTKKSIILSKYVLGYISAFAASILSLLAQLIISLIKQQSFKPEAVLVTLSVLCVALIMQAFNLPFMFKLGVEKGRLIFMALIAVVFIIGIVFGDKIALSLSIQLDNIFIIGILGVVITILINIISIFFSIKIYQSKER